MKQKCIRIQLGYNDPESKRETKEWHSSKSSAPKQVHERKSAKNLLMSGFWGDKGILLVDYL